MFGAVYHRKCHDGRRYIAAPVSVRQQQVQQLLGCQCGCRRCQLEASLPDDVTEMVTSIYHQASAGWASRMQDAVVGSDAAALTELQVSAIVQTSRLACLCVRVVVTC